MATNKSQGLFSAAIMQSNPVGFAFHSLSGANHVGKRFVAAVQACAGLSGQGLLRCLRRQDALALERASNHAIIGLTSLKDVQKNSMAWAPVIDNDELPDQVLHLFKAGRQQKIPLLIGANVNEFDTFVDGIKKFLPILNNFELDLALLDIFGTEAAWQITSWYPAAKYPNVFARLSRIVTDWIFLCASNQLAKHHGASGAPTFLYRFDQKPAFHGLELPFVFGSDNVSKWWPGAAELSAAMQEFWTAFAGAGHAPQSSSARKWPKLGNQGTTGIVFNSVKTSANITANADWPACAMWDSVGYLRTSSPPLLHMPPLQLV